MPLVGRLESGHGLSSLGFHVVFLYFFMFFFLAFLSEALENSHQERSSPFGIPVRLAVQGLLSFSIPWLILFLLGSLFAFFIPRYLLFDIERTLNGVLPTNRVRVGKLSRWTSLRPSFRVNSPRPADNGDAYPRYAAVRKILTSHRRGV